jgi:hypothetical protein
MEGKRWIITVSFLACIQIELDESMPMRHIYALPRGDPKRILSIESFRMQPRAIEEIYNQDPTLSIHPSKKNTLFA